MARQNNEKVYLVPSFEKGMQRRSTKFLAQVGDLFLAKNVDLQFKLGGIAKALGYSQKGNSINSGANVLGAGSLNTSGGTNKLLAFSGTDAYVYNSGTENWDAQSRTFTASQSFETENFLDMLFVVNGLTDAPQSYTGSAWSTTTNVTDMPKAKYIRQAETFNRLFLFNINVPVGGNFPSRVWYSDLPKNNAITWGFESNTDLATTANSAVITSAGSLFKTRGIKVGDPIFITTGSDAGQYFVESVDSNTQLTLTETLTATASSQSFWVGGNWFDVARDNSDVGMGLGFNFDRILCFKRFSVSKFLKTADVATDTLVEVKGVPGTTSGRSITNCRQYTFYWSDSGLWRLDSVSGQLITNALQEVVDGIAAANLSSVVGWSVNDRIVKMFVGDVSNSDTGLTINKCVVCYDVVTNALWTESLDHTIRSQVRWIESSAKKNFIFSSNGLSLQTENTQKFISNNIALEAETPYYFPIAPEVNLNFTRFKVYTERGSNVVIKYKLAYYDINNGFTIDDDWRGGKTSYRTEHEQEIKLPEDIQKASGFALRFEEQSPVRPVVERVAAYYSGGDLR